MAKCARILVIFVKISEKMLDKAAKIMYNYIVK